MIKAAVRLQRQKMAGIVAGIAFDDRLHMKFGLTDGGYTVMAAAAIAKDFLMIDNVDSRKA